MVGARWNYLKDTSCGQAESGKTRNGPEK